MKKLLNSFLQKGGREVMDLDASDFVKRIEKLSPTKGDTLVFFLSDKIPPRLFGEVARSVQRHSMEALKDRGVNAIITSESTLNGVKEYKTEVVIKLLKDALAELEGDEKEIET